MCNMNFITTIFAASFISLSSHGKTPSADYGECTLNHQMVVVNKDDEGIENDDLGIIDRALTLTVDFTDPSNKNCQIYNVWSVANRISPVSGSNVRQGLSINLIRMLGGILKKGQPCYDYDICRYNDKTGEYEYDFTPLFVRLDKIVNSETPIYQFVLDQPDWAFQHGYTFIRTGTRDNKNFRENEKKSIYGNSLPPCNKTEYAQFIKELFRQLINRYGKNKVSGWRFRIGSEIETPDHWFGTEQDFISHFKNVAKAVREVLPEAQIGPHTRFYDFVYSKQNYVNYKGEKVQSFARSILEKCKNENIKINFWGLSDYILVNDKDSRNIPAKFDKLFGKFLNDPNWDSSTTFDLMEYSSIVSMGTAGNTYINCVTSHTPVIELCLSNLFYKYHNKGLRYIYRWGNSSGQKEETHISLLNRMNGMQGYNATVKGTPKTASNIVDAICAASGNEKLDILVYNYNVESFDYSDTDEPVNIVLETSLPAGTKMRYKSISYSAMNNKLNQYLLKYGSMYLKNDKGVDEKGDPRKCLNSTGLRLYNEMPEPENYEESEWKEIIVSPNPQNKDKRIIKITTELPSFSYKLFEFRNM